MANVTFSSPIMPKDVTVYAIAGDRRSILYVAKKNKIPIPLDCEDGECGSCLVEVIPLGQKPFMAVDLTEKEKHTLYAGGKISKQQIADTEVTDMPPKYRLACQYIVRDEDILVRFSGEPGVAAA
jgi:ferredoxin